MPATGRLFVCARCRAQVIVCRRCDRGQISCDGDCSEIASQASVRVTGRRYQHSRHGRARRTDAPLSQPPEQSDASGFLCAWRRCSTGTDFNDVGGNSGGVRYRPAFA
jgi:hypothetical protein